MLMNGSAVIVGQEYHDSILADDLNYYTLNVPVEGKYAFSVRNTQSDLDLWLTNGAGNPLQYNFHCDYYPYSADEFCFVYLKPGNYVIAIGEWDNIAGNFDLLVNYEGYSNAKVIKMDTNYHEEVKQHQSSLYRLSFESSVSTILTLENTEAESVEFYDENFCHVSHCKRNEQIIFKCPIATESMYFEIVSEDIGFTVDFSIASEQQSSSLLGPK